MKIIENAEYKICQVSWISKKNYKQKEYAFLLVPLDKLRKLERKIQTMQEYNLEDYGIIIEKGINNPTSSVISRIENKFRCKF